jgi:hypothetical protein
VTLEELLEARPEDLTDDQLQEAVPALEGELAATQYGTRGHAVVEAKLDAVLAEAQRRA